MNRGEIAEGLRGGLLMSLSTSPFAILFGALAVDNGISVAEAGLMSTTIYAGASQLVGIELFGNHVAAWLIVFSIFAVNFRHLLYSAAVSRLIPHFTLGQKILAFFLLIDPQFAEVARRADAGKPITFGWYLAFALAIYFPWIIFSVIGAAFGSLIGDPQVWAIDVLLPVYFLGITAGFRRKPGFYPVALTSFVVSIAAYFLVGSPWHVSIGAAFGVLVGALLPLPPANAPKPAEADH